MGSALTLDLEAHAEGFVLRVAWSPSARALALFGPSGAGKTTVLEALAGLRRDVRGRIVAGDVTWLDSATGVFVPPRRRGVGYVPQDLLLFPHLDVRGNVLAGRRRAAAAGTSLSAERVLDVLGLAGLAARPVGTLSGGERRRVALARALASAPSLLLLDEPLSGLDLELRSRVLPYLLRVREAFALPTVYVSHEPAEVELLADEVLVLRDGRAVAAGEPASVLHAEGVETGAPNVLRGRVREVDGAEATVELEPELELVVPGAGLRPGLAVAILVRPEDWLVARQRPDGLSAQNVIPGTVEGVRATASDAHVLTARLGHGGVPVRVALTARAVSDLDLAPGRPIWLVAKARACRVLLTG